MEKCARCKVEYGWKNMRCHQILNDWLCDKCELLFDKEFESFKTSFLNNFCPKCNFSLIDIISWDQPIKFCQRCNYEQNSGNKLYDNDTSKDQEAAQSS